MLYEGDEDHRDRGHELQYAVYEDIDTNADEDISFEELQHFFEEWSLRELREFSEDLNYKYELSKITKDTPDAAEKLKEMERERRYMEKLELRRLERFKANRQKFFTMIENVELDAPKRTAAPSTS